MSRPKLVFCWQTSIRTISLLLLLFLSAVCCAWETRRLLYFRDTVVRATILQSSFPMYYDSMVFILSLLSSVTIGYPFWLVLYSTFCIRTKCINVRMFVVSKQADRIWDHLNENCCPVGWDSKIHRLHLCRWVRLLPHQQVSWYMTLNNLMLRFQ